MANIITITDPTIIDIETLLTDIQALGCGWNNDVIGVGCLDAVDNFLFKDSCDDPYLSVRHITIHRNGKLGGDLIHPSFEHLCNTPYLDTAKHTKDMNLFKCTNIKYNSSYKELFLKYNGHGMLLSLVHKSEHSINDSTFFEYKD